MSKSDGNGTAGAHEAVILAVGVVVAAAAVAGGGGIEVATESATGVRHQSM